jgi:hypothetical protein
MTAAYAEALRKFGGLKVLFIQDEYDSTEVARRWIERLGIHVIFTCVPKDYVQMVYPPSRFPYVEFQQTLTGYVPIHLERPARPLKPLNRRKCLLGYRGRELPYWYGDLGREKLVIGQRMRDHCEKRGISCDIEWSTEKRIYGPRWYEFLEDCKGTLGTESGANVFDFDGRLRAQIESQLAREPQVTYPEIHRRYLADHEGRVVMNQISPKVFEAIALKTALILFDGCYSGVLQPNVHYIPLKKDFSNVEEVFQKLQDDGFLTELTQRAHRDIVQSGRYSYRTFIQEMDDFITERVRRGNDIEFVSGVIGIRRGPDGNVRQRKAEAGYYLRSRPLVAPLGQPQCEDDPDYAIEMTLHKMRLAARGLRKHRFLFRVARKLYYSVREPLYRWLDRSAGKA